VDLRIRWGYQGRGKGRGGWGGARERSIIPGGAWETIEGVGISWEDACVPIVHKGRTILGYGKGIY